MKELEKIIRDVRARLTWSVREEAGTSGEFQVVSSPRQKEHVIYWPAPGSSSGPPRKIELLHEHLHALLAEQVHHQFSGQYFARRTPIEFINTVTWPCRAACDWFVDSQLIALAPDQEKAEIEESFGIICQAFQKGTPPNDVFFLLSAGLIIAQAVKYLGVEVQTGGQLKQVVDDFLSTPPEQPSVQALEGLINRLLMAFTSLQVRLVKDKGLEVWDVLAP